MSIALLYERLKMMKTVLKQTAQELGLDLTFIPYRKIAFVISKDGFLLKLKARLHDEINQTKVF
jgi:hypothetical protein